LAAGDIETSCDWWRNIISRSARYATFYAKVNSLQCGKCGAARLPFVGSLRPAQGICAAPGFG
jgi:hypothetical protein